FKGMGVTEGDTIRTGKNGYARVEFDRNNATSLGGNTTITIAELRNRNGVPSTKVKQRSGGVWNKAKKTVGAGNVYEVATPTSIMGVRGTMFLTYIENERTRLTVLDGIVAADRARSRTSPSEST